MDCLAFEPENKHTSAGAGWLWNLLINPLSFLKQVLVNKSQLNIGSWGTEVIGIKGNFL